MDCLELSEIIEFSLDAGKTYRERFNWHNNLKQFAMKEFLKRPITDNIQHVRTTGSVGSGKAQPLYAIVQTPAGPCRMGDVQVGQMVFARDGSAYPVAAVWPQGVKQVCRVEFTDGSVVDCCEDHLWDVQKLGLKNSAHNPFETMALRDLLPVSKGNKRKWRVPLCNPLQLPESAQPLDPYLLGAILGNGALSSGNCKLSSQNKVLIAHLQSLLPTGDWLALSPREGVVDCDYAITSGPRRANNPDGSYSSSQTRKALSALGLMGRSARTKFIPNAYLTASVTQRRRVLAGLLDTDGYACPGGGVEYTSASVHLIEGVAWLTRSLGGVVRYRKSKMVAGWEYGRIQLNFQENPFILLSKRVAWVQPTKYFPSKIIARVTPLGEEECQCITAGSPDGTYLTGDMVVTHNTTFWIAWFYELQETFPGASILAMRNTHGQLMTALYAQIKKFYMDFGIDAHYRESKSSGAPIIELKNGSKWVFWSAQSVIESTTSDTARGLGGSEFSGALIEEADSVPVAAVDTVSARMREKSGAWPRVIAYSDNPTVETHWLHKRFNPDPRQAKVKENAGDFNSMKFTMEDNAKNLLPNYISSQRSFYADKPAQFRRFVLGEPGPEIRGIPIYGPYFNRDHHIAQQSFVDNWTKQRSWEDGPVCICMDFGYRHPAMVVIQDVEIGTFRQLRFLMAWLGDSVTLKPFTQFYLDTIAQLLPNAELKTYCDPAGMNADPRGVTAETAIDTLRSCGLSPQFKKSSEPYGVDLIIDLLGQVNNHPIMGFAPAIICEPNARYSQSLIDMFTSGFCQDENVKRDILKPVDDGHFIHLADAARYGVIHRRSLNKNRERAKVIDREDWVYSRDAGGGLYRPSPVPEGLDQDFDDYTEYTTEASYFGGG
jgi:hypothetical protein